MTSKITRERLQEIAEDGFLKHGESKELARMALAAMDGEPVAEVVSIYGDPEAFGEREIRPLVGIQQMPYGTKLYRHTQPAPVVPDFKKLARELVDNLVDCGGLDEGVKEKYLEWAEKTCHAAMFAAAPQENN